MSSGISSSCPSLTVVRSYCLDSVLWIRILVCLVTNDGLKISCVIPSILKKLQLLRSDPFNLLNVFLSVLKLRIICVDCAKV
jgi:hypothetical protein